MSDRFRASVQKCDFTVNFRRFVNLSPDFGGIAQLSGASYSRSLIYNAKNQIMREDSVSVQYRTGSAYEYDSFFTISRNDYDGDADLDTASGNSYALGAIVWQHQEKWKVSYTGNNSTADVSYDASITTKCAASPLPRSPAMLKQRLP